MAVEVQDGQLIIEGMVPVEEVEDLVEALESLDPNEPASVDLSKCLHLHTAGVQALRIRRCKVIAWPEASEWTEWLKAGLEQ